MELNQRKNPTPKRDWRRAFGIIRAVIDDPTRTEEVIEIIDALVGPSFEKSFLRFARDPDGQRLLAEKPDLLATLSDRERLRSLPAGTFGRVYADFMSRGGITATGLVEASDEARDRFPEAAAAVEDADREWFGDRMRDQHDLWHVLTGYGMDEAGEAANLSFSVGQFFNPGMLFLVSASVFVVNPQMKFRWMRYMFQAWRRSMTMAKNLNLARYEELLELPLEQVRRQLGVPPAQQFHPDGIGVLVRHTEGDDEIVWRFAAEPAVSVTI
jgi:ubiquinone biosynthesis protein COQ4